MFLDKHRRKTSSSSHCSQSISIRTSSCCSRASTIFAKVTARDCAATIRTFTQSLSVAMSPLHDSDGAIAAGLFGSGAKCSRGYLRRHNHESFRACVFQESIQSLKRFFVRT